MQSVKTYSSEYIDQCKKQFNADLDKFDALSLPKATEHVVAKYLLFGLELMFVHRLRGQEGKDGNPLNEVRILCDSLFNNKGVLLVDSGIQYKEEKTVLGVPLGGEIMLTFAHVKTLSDAYFCEIEKRF